MIHELGLGFELLIIFYYILQLARASHFYSYLRIHSFMSFTIVKVNDYKKQMA